MILRVRRQRDGQELADIASVELLLSLSVQLTLPSLIIKGDLRYDRDSLLGYLRSK